MIIGICGLIGSGKGTVADILEDGYGFTKMSFADSLKDAVSSVFGWPRAMLEGDTVESREWREQIDAWWANRLGIPHLTPSWVLQYWGTEVCRQGFHPDIWIASMERKLQMAGDFVIPDLRFPNEVSMVREMGGSVWRVKRGDDPEWLLKYQSHNIIPTDIHPSEWEWATSRFDEVVLNNETVGVLHDRVNTLLIQSR